jgi:hypothetical protein
MHDQDWKWEQGMRKYTFHVKSKSINSRRFNKIGYMTESTDQETRPKAPLYFLQHASPPVTTSFDILSAASNTFSLLTTWLGVLQ